MQTQTVITSDQAAQNSANVKDEEEYDIDHDHLLLPWSCCIPIVLDKFQAKQACCDHYSYARSRTVVSQQFIIIILSLPSIFIPLVFYLIGLFAKIKIIYHSFISN